MKSKEKKDDRAIKFGERVRQVRKILKLSQKEFAQRIGMANNYLSEIESGNVKPGFEFFYKIADGYDVNLIYLLFGEDSMFRKTGGEKRKGKLAGIDISGMDYGVSDGGVENFLFYFFNSNFVRYHFMAELIRVLNDNKQLIDKEIEEKKAAKEKK